MEGIAAASRPRAPWLEVRARAREILLQGGDLCFELGEAPLGGAKVALRRNNPLLRVLSAVELPEPQDAEEADHTHDRQRPEEREEKTIP